MNKIFNKKVFPLVGLIALISLVSFLAVTKAQNYTGTGLEILYSSSTYSYAPSVYAPSNIVVNSPNTFLGPEYHLQPGDTFDFQLDFSALACTNTYEDVYVYTLPKDSWFNGLPTESTSISTSESSSGDAMNNAYWDDQLEIYSAQFDRYSSDSGDDYNTETNTSSDSYQEFYIPEDAYSAILVKSYRFINDPVTVSVNHKTNVFTSRSHGFSNGDQVWFDPVGTTLPIPLLLTQVYTISDATTDTFKLKLDTTYVDIGGPHEFIIRNFQPAAEGGYIAPQTPGTYPFYFYIRNVINSGYIVGYTLGVIPVTVADPAETNDGVCGTANTGTYTLTDFNDLSNSSLCSIGAVTGPTYTPGIGWTWGCNVSDPYEDASCSAKYYIYIEVPPGGGPDGVCGGASSYDTSAWASRSLESLCDWGDPINVDVDLTDGLNPDRWDWTCDVVVPNTDANCFALDSTGVSGGPTLTNVIINPNVVNSGGSCKISWTVIDNSVNGGSCIVWTTTGTAAISSGLNYTAGTTTNFSEKDVDPKKTYYVECTDSVNSALKKQSERMTCIENPNLIEF